MPLYDYLQTHPFGRTGTVRDDYRPDIVGPTGTLPSIEAVQTVGIGSDSRMTTIYGDTVRQWVLEPGAADPANAGHVAPLDYDAGFNSVHWEVQG